MLTCVHSRQPCAIVNSDESARLSMRWCWEHKAHRAPLVRIVYICQAVEFGRNVWYVNNGVSAQRDAGDSSSICNYPKALYFTDTIHLLVLAICFMPALLRRRKQKYQNLRGESQLASTFIHVGRCTLHVPNSLIRACLNRMPSSGL